MARAAYIPDEMLDAEMERLRGSESVKIAMKERRLKIDKKRKCLNQLRWLERRGNELLEMGWTFETLDQMFEETEESEV